jgi:hypothetical protein
MWSAYFWDRLLWTSKDLMIDRMVDSGKPIMEAIVKFLMPSMWRKLMLNLSASVRCLQVWGQERQESRAKIISLLRRYIGHIVAKVFKHSLKLALESPSCWVIVPAGLGVGCPNKPIERVNVNRERHENRLFFTRRFSFRQFVRVWAGFPNTSDFGLRNHSHRTKCGKRMRRLFGMG